MAEKDGDVIALGDLSSLDRQRGERPIFAEPEFAGPAPKDFPTLGGLDDYLIARVRVLYSSINKRAFPAERWIVD